MAKINIDLLIRQANDYAGKGDWEIAYNTLLQASAMDSNHPGVINGLATCLIQIGKPKEAINLFEKLVNIVPNPQDAYCSLGIAYESIGELASGEEAYLKVLQIDPKNIAARKGLAVIYLQQVVRFGEGIQILKALVKSNSDDLEALLMLANCYEQTRNIPAAKELYEQALKTHPKNKFAKEGLVRVGEVKQGLSSK
jgi:tetratricopeptide (TPR) repeat protein